MLFSYLAVAESELLSVQQTISKATVLKLHNCNKRQLRRALKYNVYNLSLTFSSQNIHYYVASIMPYDLKNNEKYIQRI